MFPFEIRTDLDAPILVGDDGAVVLCRFRHSNDTAIRLLPGHVGEFNLGFRVYAAGDRHVFEDRMQPDRDIIEPGERADCTASIPRRVIRVCQWTRTHFSAA